MQAVDELENVHWLASQGLICTEGWPRTDSQSTFITIKQQENVDQNFLPLKLHTSVLYKLIYTPT